MRTLLFLSLFLIVAMTLALMPTTPVEGDGQRPSVGFFSFKGLVVITNPEAPPRAYPNQNANGQRVLEHFLKGNYQIPSNIISQNLLQGRSGKDNVPGQIPIYANDTIYTVTPDSVAHVNLNNGGLIWMTEISGIRIPDRVVNIPQNSNAYLAAQFGNVRVRVNNYRTRTDEYQVITP
jgi:outer membrane protein assembly factor BamB